MTRVVPTPIDDLAIMVWAELATVGDSGLSAWEIRKLLPTLSKYQVRRGLDRINHVLQLSRERPMACFHERGRGAVYRLPEYCPDYRTFALSRLQELITRSHTELIRAEAAVLRWPEELAVYLPKMLRRTIEDLEDIIVEFSDADDDPR